MRDTVFDTVDTVRSPVGQTVGLIWTSAGSAGDSRRF
jgi:hypothetical protein